jgi:hypothetical protein
MVYCGHLPAKEQAASFFVNEKTQLISRIAPGSLGLRFSRSAVSASLSRRFRRPGTSVRFVTRPCNPGGRLFPR